MPSLNENPFAVLTAVVAPAILTNACSVLALGTANRIARVVDRTRVLTAEVVDHAPGSAGCRQRVSQLEWLQVRAHQLLRALRLFYAALGSFAAAALVAVVGSVLAAFNLRLAFQAAATVGLAIGGAGVLGLVAGCVLMVHETRLAVQTLAEEAEAARSR
jgi:hypothetical protein